MIVLEHVLMRPQIELVIVLCELSIADGAVLVHDASHFYDAAHPRGVSAELYHLHLAIYKKREIYC